MGDVGLAAGAASMVGVGEQAPQLVLRGMSAGNKHLPVSFSRLVSS